LDLEALWIAYVPQLSDMGPELSLLPTRSEEQDLSLREHRAPHVDLGTEKPEQREVINIMELLKESMQAKGRAKLHAGVSRRMGTKERKTHAKPWGSRSSPRRTAH
jgi:hypothetical protein